MQSGAIKRITVVDAICLNVSRTASEPLRMHDRAQSLPGAAKTTYRPDLDGLRALAVLSVVLFHADVIYAPGGYVGVDVFFVISGYLITSLLFAELDRTGKIDFLAFWARRTRRLLPLALLVIGVSLAASSVVLSKLQLQSAGQDALFAATYTTNWQKLASAVDYFNEDAGAGLFLHYWSLAVEEQFYAFLTIVFATALGLTFWTKKGPAFTSTVAISLLAGAGVLSFIASIVAAGYSQPEAFFGTHTRIWQLALGAGVGQLERGMIDLRLWQRHFLAWVGLGLIVFPVLFYTDQLVYPGYYVIAPSLGAAALILSGIQAARAFSLRQLPLPLLALSHSLPVQIGKLSYALYLWHWPVFMLYKAHFVQWEMMDRGFAIAMTLALAVICHLAIENPIRFSAFLQPRPLFTLASSLLMTLGICGITLATQRAAPGKAVLLAGGQALTTAQIRQDQPRTYADRCHSDQKGTGFGRCVYGAIDSPHKIFLLGDSHANHLFPAIEQIAKKHGYALYSRTKSACIGIDVAVWNVRWKREYTECAAWRNNVLNEIEKEKPDLVVLANSSAHRPYISAETKLAEGEEAAQLLVAGEKRTLARLLNSGAKVALIADLAWLPDDPIDCLIENPGSVDVCRWPVKAAIPKLRSPWSTANDRQPANVRVVDLLPTVCPEGFCYAAARDMVVMRDRHHLTATFAATLADRLDAELFGLLDEPSVVAQSLTSQSLAGQSLKGLTTGLEK
jgi:peptidoglycan/LPS O-acetylase OafA/YrhL